MPRPDATCCRPRRCSAPAASTAEAVVRRHAGELLGADPTGWEVVARHEVPRALPAQPAPYSARRPVALGGGLYVCGDHRDTGSIQGALVSGRRAAAAVARRAGDDAGVAFALAPPPTRASR